MTGRDYVCMFILCVLLLNEGIRGYKVGELGPENSHLRHHKYNNSSHVPMSIDTVKTFAGTGNAGRKDAVGTAAMISFPVGLVNAKDGLSFYFTERGNPLIRKYTYSTNKIVTISGGSEGFMDGYGANARLNSPTGMTLDASGQYLIIADTGNHCLRILDLMDYSLTTLAGRNIRGYVDAKGLSARFNNPYDVVSSSDGSQVYISDFNNYVIRVLDMNTKDVTTLAGSGVPGTFDEVGTLAQFYNPAGIALHPSQNYLLVVDNAHHRVRRIDLTNNYVSTYCGTGQNARSTGACSITSFSFPHGVIIRQDGLTALIADAGSNRIVQIDLTTATSSVFLGTGSAGSRDGDKSVATFNDPRATLEGPNGAIIIADYGNHKFRVYGALPPVSPVESHTCAACEVNTGTGNGMKGSYDGLGTVATFNDPISIAMHPSNLFCFIADAGNHRIRRMEIVDYSITTIAGAGSPAYTDGVGIFARFNFPRGVAFTINGALIADSMNHRIRYMSNDASVTTYAGNGIAATVDGPLSSASFNMPYGIAVSPDGVYAVITEYSGHVVRYLNLVRGVVTTLAGNGVAGLKNGVGADAMFYHPIGVAIGLVDGQLLCLVVDRNNNMLRSIDISTGRVMTYCGMAYTGYREGSCDVALFDGPNFVAMGGGRIVVSDTNNNRVREIFSATKTTRLIAGSGAAGNQNGAVQTASFNGIRGLAVSVDGDRAYGVDTHNQMIKVIDLVTPRGPSSPPTLTPTQHPTSAPTAAPTSNPTLHPTFSPTITPTSKPTNKPTPLPSSAPSQQPTPKPTTLPTLKPTSVPTLLPTISPTSLPSERPTSKPTADPTLQPTPHPTLLPTYSPTSYPTVTPTSSPTPPPTFQPTINNFLVQNVAGGNGIGSKDGDICSSQLNHPGSLAEVSSNIIVADEYNHILRLYDVVSGELITFAGCGKPDFADGVGLLACFHNPHGIAVHPANGFVLVTDIDNNVIRLVTMSSAAVTTPLGSREKKIVDGAGIQASFHFPYGISIDPAGRYAYITELYTHVIRRADLYDWSVATVAGSGNCGSQGGQGILASFCQPRSISVSPAGDVAVVADMGINQLHIMHLKTFSVQTGCADEHGKRKGLCSEAGQGAVIEATYDLNERYVYASTKDHVLRFDMDSGTATILATGENMGMLRGGIIGGDKIYVTGVDSIKAIEKNYGQTIKDIKRCSKSTNIHEAEYFLKNNVAVTTVLSIIAFAMLIAAICWKLQGCKSK